MMSNNSKPYQAQLIQKSGLRVPDTLITNDPDLVMEFRGQHRQIIYKSISGVRSIVRKFQEEDLRRLDKIRWCPVQFQEYIEGFNVRVHVVGNEVFSTLVRSDATDYRYAEAELGMAAELEAYELAADSAQRCINLAASLDLPFAGIDLKVTPDGEVFCFEVNPCPGFSYYESHTGQPIAMAVARYLTGLSAA
jgi:glutathione synthase/RimK-type ligase-like ATP-grasp enzyme